MSYLGKTIERGFYYCAPLEIRDTAKELRLKLTESENILWQALRNKRLDGFLFRRQHAVYIYIVDFYCHQARLVIEVDGRIYERKDKREQDLNRTADLERLGLKVIRFPNHEVSSNLINVLARIKDELHIRTTQ